MITREKLCDEVTDLVRRYGRHHLPEGENARLRETIALKRQLLAAWDTINVDLQSEGTSLEQLQKGGHAEKLRARQLINDRLTPEPAATRS